MGQHLEVEDNIKLLGIIKRGDMKWDDNTTYICRKGYDRLWMFRRLKHGTNVLEIS